MQMEPIMTFIYRGTVPFLRDRGGISRFYSRVAGYLAPDPLVSPFKSRSPCCRGTAGYYGEKLHRFPRSVVENGKFLGIV